MENRHGFAVDGTITPPRVENQGLGKYRSMAASRAPTLSKAPRECVAW
jgi:hypothetical protein